MQKVFLKEKVNYMPLFRQKTAIKQIGDILRIRPITINYKKRGLKRMYSIVLKDGKIINVNANQTNWWNKDRTLTLCNDGNTVGVFNVDNIAGFINSDCVAESEGKE